MANQKFTELKDNAISQLKDLEYRIGKIKDEAMDNDLDELASELNAIQNQLEVDARRLRIIGIKSLM